MIQFENPGALLLLLLVPFLFLLRALKVCVPLSFPLTLGDWHGASFSWNGTARTVCSVFSRVLTAGGFVCLVLAAANPVVHHQEKVYLSRGADILYVVDVSPSMAARDMSGLTRLEAAKAAIRALETENGGDTVGLVEVAKEAAVVVPPTMDRGVFFRRLDGLTVGEQGDGTSLGTGLACALFHLQASASPRRTVVLITDGENNAGSIHPHTAAHLLAERNISLYVLGIGTKGRVPLEYVDPKTGRLYSGTLESNYDTAVLSQVAAEAGGKFFEASSVDALSQALDTVSKSESLVQSYHIRNSDVQFYARFLLVAAALFAAAFFVRRICLQEVL